MTSTNLTPSPVSVAAREAYISRWPVYCQACAAVGCAECFARGICPRCGRMGITTDGQNCAYCAFEAGNPDHQLPLLAYPKPKEKQNDQLDQHDQTSADTDG